MGRVQIPRHPGVIAAVCVALLGGPHAFAQEVTPVAPVSQAPLPVPRSIRQEVPAEPAEPPPAEPREVTIVIPGEEQPVTIVFGDENPEPSEGADATDAEGETPEEGTQTERWQAERDKRFRRAPQRARTSQHQAGTGPAVPIRTPDTALTAGAELRMLDKMTGKTVTYTVPVGVMERMDRLDVRLDACRAPVDGAAHGTMAFLKIWDTKSADPEAVFAGWMFAESPALSALDHPRYDLWVIRCTTSSGETSAARQ